MPVFPGRIAALVLAAGGGRRLGGGKLLLPWRGEPIISHVVRLAAGVGDEVVVVVGHRAGAVREALARFAAARIVENPDWAAGQSTSLRRGIATVAVDDVRGVMVMLGDQPLVSQETLELLRRAHLDACSRDPDHPATTPEYAGRRGNPVILSPCLFPGIAALRGDVGARDVLAALGDRLLRVAVDDPGVVRDIDTPEDYRAL